MSLEDSIVTALKAQATVTKWTGKRIYKDKAPQRAGFPRVVIERLDSERQYDSGALPSNQLVRGEFDVLCQGSDSKAYSLADAVRKYMNGLTGTIQGTVIRRTTMEDKTNFTQFKDGSEDGLHEVAQTYSIWHMEATS